LNVEISDSVYVDEIDANDDDYTDTTVSCESNVRAVPYTSKNYEQLETLCIINNIPITLLSDMYGKYNDLMIGKHLIVRQPILYVDSVGPTSFKFSNLTKSITVNFRNRQDIIALCNLFKTADGFEPYYKNYERSITESDGYQYHSYCGSYIDYPTATHRNAELINRWLRYTLVNETLWRDDEIEPYPTYKQNTADKASLAKYCADRFFYYNSYSGTYFYAYDMRVAISKRNYITYQQLTYTYLSGAHGFYTERLPTLDLLNGKAITVNYLFKKSELSNVKELVVRTALRDDNYRYWHDEQDYEDAIVNFSPADNETSETKADIANVNISDVGLTDKGVVFSYQPYEIACFAAGCFHFLIPYSTLAPYMTDHAKQLVGIV
jgi:hypothetical protein